MLSTWSDQRLAEQTIVVPVDEAQVATLAPEVAAGAGGVILFGGTAQLGFHGLVLTDSLSAVAIQNAGYTVPQAAVAAIEAGADIILFNASATDVATVNQSIASALLAAEQAGGLSRDRLLDAVGHVLSAKGANLCAA